MIGFLKPWCLQVVIVNGPFGGGQVWNLAKVFIPPSTREKISICSSE